MMELSSLLFTKVTFLVVLALLSTSQADFLGARRARGRSNFIQRGSRELAGYSGGGQAQYGQGECGGEKETGAGKGISGLFLTWTGAFCFEFSGRGRKSGSAYALVDLVTSAPLLLPHLYTIIWVLVF